MKQWVLDDVADFEPQPLRVPHGATRHLDLALVEVNPEDAAGFGRLPQQAGETPVPAPDVEYASVPRTGPRPWRSGTANPADSLVAGDPTHDPGHRRHQVDVTVRVPGQREDPPGACQRRLRADLGGELTGSNAAAEEAFGELGEAEKSAV